MSSSSRDSESPNQVPNRSMDPTPIKSNDHSISQLQQVDSNYAKDDEAFSFRESDSTVYSQQQQVLQKNQPLVQKKESRSRGSSKNAAKNYAEVMKKNLQIEIEDDNGEKPPQADQKAAPVDDKNTAMGKVNNLEDTTKFRDNKSFSISPNQTPTKSQIQNQNASYYNKKSQQHQQPEINDKVLQKQMREVEDLIEESKKAIADEDDDDSQQQDEDDDEDADEDQEEDDEAEDDDDEDDSDQVAEAHHQHHQHQKKAVHHHHQNNNRSDDSEEQNHDDDEGSGQNQGNSVSDDDDDNDDDDEEQQNDEDDIDEDDDDSQLDESERERRQRAKERVRAQMPTRRKKKFEVNYTVGRIEDGNAILLSSEHNILDVPLMLLPKNIKPGNILKFKVERNLEMERKREAEILSIQKQILEDPNFFANI